MKYCCVICNTELIKTIYRRESHFYATKEVPVSDRNYPSGKERIEKVYCPKCLILYDVSAAEQ